MNDATSSNGNLPEVYNLYPYDADDKTSCGRLIATGVGKLVHSKEVSLIDLNENKSSKLFEKSCVAKAPLVTMGRLNFTLKTVPSLRR